MFEAVEQQAQGEQADHTVGAAEAGGVAEGARSGSGFSPGVQGAFEALRESRLEQAAALDACRTLRRQLPEKEAEFQAALDMAEPVGPLWQEISGIDPRYELELEPSVRRAGIRRLLRAVEKMFRDELNSADMDADSVAEAEAQAQNPDSGWRDSARYGRRSALWDPLNEVCLYLQISKTKLNELSVQRTGLRAGELCDCIRAEKLKPFLKEKFGPLVRTWFEKLDERERTAIAMDAAEGAWRFLKWVRGGGRGQTRKKLALEMGMGSRGRLDRAVFVCSRESLEEVEVEIAMRLIQEMVFAPVRYEGVPDFLKSGFQGAEKDEVAAEEVRGERLGGREGTGGGGAL